jgi:TrmH family RNA methyltransferase
MKIDEQSKWISSITNSIVKEAIRVRERHQQFKNTAFFIEGPHLLETAIQDASVAIQHVFIAKSFFNHPDGRRLYHETLRRVGTSRLVHCVTDKVMTKLSDTNAPQGIAAVVSIPQRTLQEINTAHSSMLVACDHIQDPGNVGTIIRLADAVNADAVVMLVGSANPFSPKSVRSSAGSIFHVPIVFTDNTSLIRFVHQKKIALIATAAQAARSCYHIDLRKPCIIVLGSEAHGVSTELLTQANEIVHIPIHGRAESLNVAVSCAVILYEAVRQREPKV